MGRRLILLALATVGTLAGMVAAGAPAGAECIEVDFAVHVTGQPDYYPLGPGYCATDTPWNQTDGVRSSYERSGLPPGVPSGFWLEVTYTSP